MSRRSPARPSPANLELDRRDLTQAGLTADDAQARCPVGGDDHCRPSLPRRGRNHRIHGYSLPQELPESGPYRSQRGCHAIGSRATCVSAGAGHGGRRPHVDPDLGLRSQLPVRHDPPSVGARNRRRRGPTVGSTREGGVVGRRSRRRRSTAAPPTRPSSTIAPPAASTTNTNSGTAEPLSCLRTARSFHRSRKPGEEWAVTRCLRPAGRAPPWRPSDPSRGSSRARPWHLVLETRCRAPTCEW